MMWFEDHRYLISILKLIKYFPDVCYIREIFRFILFFSGIDTSMRLFARGLRFLTVNHLINFHIYQYFHQNNE